MAGNVIGNIECPVCGHEAPVKEDKNGHAYVHCAHSCNAQVFARNAHRDGLLRKRMRAVTVPDPDPVATPDDRPAPDAHPVSVPKPAPVVTVPPITEPKPKANWFHPIMGAKHGRA